MQDIKDLDADIALVVCEGNLPEGIAHSKSQLEFHDSMRTKWALKFQGYLRANNLISQTPAKNSGDVNRRDGSAAMYSMNNDVPEFTGQTVL